MPGFRGLTVARLARILGYSGRRLGALAAKVDRHYRRHPVTIGSKTRVLTIPSGELKHLQRTLLTELFYQLPQLGCLGHGRRRGVLWTLKRHERDSHLFHTDVKSFFPSVSAQRVRRALLGLKTTSAAAELLTQLVTHDDQLPQGAPTSVAVADAVLYPIDLRISGLAAAHGLTYTRYMDDLALSGPGAVVTRFSKVVVEYLEEDGWVLSEKGGLYGPDESHRLLNAVVNRKPNVTRKYYDSVRGQLRRIARFGHRPQVRELDSLASKVVWIATVNQDRHGALLKLLHEAHERVAGNPASEVPAGDQHV